MTSQSTYVRVAPSPRIRDTHTPASDALVQLRVKHLLPRTTQRAKERVGKLKQLFAVPHEVLRREHAAAITDSLLRLRLVKAVRNIRVQGSGGSGSGSTVAGALCLPFHTCAALPAAAQVLTGSVDGLLTLWDAAQCRPLASQSTFPEAHGWGRVKSIAVHPSLIAAGGSVGAGSAASVVFSASMFQRVVRVWRVAGAGGGGAPASGMAAAAEEAPTDGAVLEPITTAAVPGGGDDAAGDAAESGVPGSSSSSSSTNKAQGGFYQLAVDPTGALLAATHASGVVHLWDARAVTEQSSSAGAAPLMHLCAQDGYESVGAPLGVAFHPDGSLLATSDAGGRLVAWDTRSGQLALHTGGRVGGHLRAAPCLAWSPCGVRVATGGADGVVHLYDARRLSRAGLGPHNDACSGAAPFQLLGHDDAVSSVSFYANPLVGGAGQLLPLGIVTTSLDHTLRVWDADTGLCVRSLDAGMPLYAQCRPALPPVSARHTAAASAVMVVGHGKTWELFDVDAAGDEEEEASAAALHAGVAVTENDIVASAQGGAGGMRFTTFTAATAAAAGGAAGGDSEEEEDEEEEDEMQALRRKPATAAAAGNGGGHHADDDDDEEESSEDEMELLRRKKAGS